MDRSEIIGQMQRAPVFRCLPLGELDRLLSRSRLVEFPAKSRLIEAGDEAQEVFVLVEGQVSVRVALSESEDRMIASRAAGDWVGEMALVEDLPRSARVVAEGPVRALRVPRNAFLELVAAAPASFDLVRTLSARLRESDATQIEILRAKVQRLQGSERRLSAENERLRSALGNEAEIERFLGSSPAAQRVRAVTRLAAASELPVLLVGETGTGKELLARAIHRASARGKQAFVALNCGLSTESLLESELFGHARGAFTGASEAKPGLVEAADGGTLFLDELADMPWPTQIALLRFLEEGEFRRVGETRGRRADVRVVAASQIDPEQAVQMGRLRPDLRFRLDVFRIPIPPLRERRSDIAELALDLIGRAAERLGVAPLTLGADTLEALSSARLEGNVRELRNEIDRLYAIGGDRAPFAVAGPFERQISAAEPVPRKYGESVRAFKTRIIGEALEATGGNVTRAAERLGLHRSNLSRMIRDLKIGPSPKRR